MPQIVAGQTLVITYDRQIEGTMQVYGYVCPFVNRDLCERHAVSDLPLAVHLGIRRTAAFWT